MTDRKELVDRFNKWEPPKIAARADVIRALIRMSDGIRSNNGWYGLTNLDASWIEAAIALLSKDHEAGG